jgi:hypothetical protein
MAKVVKIRYMFRISGIYTRIKKINKKHGKGGVKF